MTSRKRITKKPDAAQIPKDCLAIRDRLMPYAQDSIPESTACAAEGLDFDVWEKWCGKYPALRQEYKKAAARRWIDWQKTVEAGAQGWQAAAVLLERRDPINWSRTQQTSSKSKASALAAAVRNRAKK